VLEKINNKPNRSNICSTALYGGNQHQNQHLSNVLENVLDVLNVLSVECVGLSVESVELVDESVDVLAKNQQ
jgi:hypothetical protein